MAVFLSGVGSGGGTFPLIVLAPVKAELVPPDYYFVFLLETPQWLVWELGVRMALPSCLLGCLDVPCENLRSHVYPSLGSHLRKQALCSSLRLLMIN